MFISPEMRKFVQAIRTTDNNEIIDTVSNITVIAGMKLGNTTKNEEKYQLENIEGFDFDICQDWQPVKNKKFLETAAQKSNDVKFDLTTVYKMLQHHFSVGIYELLLMSKLEFTSYLRQSVISRIIDINDDNNEKKKF